MRRKGVRTGWRWRRRPADAHEERDTPLTLDAGDGEDPQSALSRAIAEMGPLRGGLPRTGEASLAYSERAPLARIADAILVQALEEGASDIHIEPAESSLRVRFRVDGLLREIMPLPPHLQGALIGRYKIQSGMSVASGRVPQEGRLTVRLDDREYDLRVSVLPSLYGESLVIHIPDSSRTWRGLHSLGLTPEIQVWVEDLVLRPGGLFLLAGPPGSGKTTTLYSLLYKLNSVERKIVTVEDPIERRMSGLVQIGLDARAGLSLGDALRSLAHQDPDILVIGELRDGETARLAVDAALAGRLVLSTLNASDTLQALRRLAEMGIDPQTLAQTVTGILAQRLVRRICPECKESTTNQTRTLPGFEFDFPGENFVGKTLFRGRGCAACRNTGYCGRIGIYELLRVNTEIAEQIVRRGSPEELRYVARAGGLRDLRADGLQKVWEGITTPEEVLRGIGPAR